VQLARKSRAAARILALKPRGLPADGEASSQGGLRMRLPIVFAVGALAALSLPGVRAARAEADLLPPAKQLFAFDARSPAPRRDASCAAEAAQLAALRRGVAAREAAMQRIAALVGAQPGEPVEVLDGRGFGYPVQRDPQLELVRIQREAQRLRAAGGN
jgi:hypothetical protein